MTDGPPLLRLAPMPTPRRSSAAGFRPRLTLGLLYMACFFVLYCLEAGSFLVLAPWVSAWEGFLAHFPIGSFHDALLEPVVRGAVSGFGLIHLVWGAHDLEYWLARRKYDARLRS